MIILTKKLVSFFNPLSLRREACSVKCEKGFTLIEMLVVLIFIGFLLAMIVPRLSGVMGNARVITTLSEMKDIKESIRDRFYLDLGLIPEDTGATKHGGGKRDPMPEYATRFLCLKDDGVGNTEYQEMFDFIEDLLGTSEANRLISWDKYSKKGWRCPYMERDYYVTDDKGTIDTSDDEDYPILADAWGSNYLIRMDSSQNKDSARIVSFGAKGEDDSEAGDDIVMWIFGTQPIRFPEGFNPEDWGN